MTRITFIVPYVGIDNLVAECLAEFRHEKVAFQTIHLIGVEEVRAHSFNSDIVVARGITCAAVRELHPELTTIEIPVTGYDVIRAIDETRRIHHSQRIAFIGARNMVYGAHDLSRYLNLAIRCYEVNQESEAEATIRIAQREGLDSIIGGLMVYAIAQEMGIPSTWISSGPHSLRQAAAEAVLAARIQSRERERSEFLNIVMDYTHEAILAVDHRGSVTAANRTAHRILKSESANLVGTELHQLRPLRGLSRVLESGREEVGTLQSTDEGMIAANFVPIMVGSDVTGAVATFQPATSIQEIERRIRRRAQAKGLVPKYNFSDILGESAEITRVIQTARRFSNVDSNILIIGETGTGKELFAHSIHSASVRKNGPFVAVNCAALPESLLESELFGYAEGAFTGASRSGKSGLFELAHDGTIFLDEIAEIPLTLQAKLLRVLQEREIMRIGGDRVIPVDVRVIAAANRSLRTSVQEGSFRSDILYRIDVLRINVPPLRRRPQDIMPLARHYLDGFRKRFSMQPVDFSIEAQDAMTLYPWPGNVRELMNLCERVAALTTGTVVTFDDVSATLAENRDIGETLFNRQENAMKRRPVADNNPHASLRESERAQIMANLRRHSFNKAETARSLGISRTTLWRKLKAAGNTE